MPRSHSQYSVELQFQSWNRKEVEEVLAGDLTGLQVCAFFREPPAPSLEGCAFYLALLLPQTPLQRPRPDQRAVAPPQPGLDTPSGHIPELPGKDLARLPW